MIDMSYDPVYERHNPMRSLRWRWRRAVLSVTTFWTFLREFSPFSHAGI